MAAYTLYWLPETVERYRAEGREGQTFEGGLGGHSRAAVFGAATGSTC
jgi:hypothetical protein